MGSTAGAALFLLATSAILALTNTFCFLMLPVLVYIIYKWIYFYYRHTTREVRRASLVAYSNVCSHFSESLNGACVIRAFRASDAFTNRNIDLLNDVMKCRFMEVG
eukprot:GHVN01020180.1.p1 GENE.GHVN01020180.1~~GHVN01020180.1.p1  ORF type:complete len:106 (-),score=8.65 GHVN01020180.1:2250-2567(-)